MKYKFNRPQYRLARARMHRRNSLWNAAKIACGSTEEFRQHLHSIARAISEQLGREFPQPTQPRKMNT
jgi:hypothetical protein